MGLLEVHAYSVMTNHFHLLVRSPVGQLAEAMRLTHESSADAGGRMPHGRASASHAMAELML